jgi:hypothetical protein
VKRERGRGWLSFFVRLALIERLSIPPSPSPSQAVTGGYPAFFNALVGGNASDCARVRPNALRQARLFSDAHYADDRGRAALAAFASRYPDVNMSACVAPGVAAEDVTWAKARCWQMVYEALSGALGAGVPLPGGATDATVAVRERERERERRRRK